MGSKTPRKPGYIGHFWNSGKTEREHEVLKEKRKAERAARKRTRKARR